jgi:hypothetical protein
METPCKSTASWSAHPLPQVKGDAFLARVFDNGDDFERQDFDISEVSSDSPWVKQAAAQNAQRRQQVRCPLGGGPMTLHVLAATKGEGPCQDLFGFTWRAWVVCRRPALLPCPAIGA